MLEVDGISKSYFGQQVLTPVSFCLPAGCCIGITGENGSGKSTLLRLLAQIERPDRGDIRFQGKSVLGDRAFLRHRVGYVPQNHDLLEELTVQSQLKLWQSACGLDGALSGEILELMELGPIMKQKIRYLSGGTKRRVSIAMALLSGPELLIMDEATAGLDLEYSQRLLECMEKHLASNGRIVWCSHHKAELDRLCGSCLRIGSGRQKKM